MLDQEEEVSQYIGDTCETLWYRSTCIFTKKCNIKQYENQLKLVEYTGRGQAILMYSTEVGKVKENDLKMQLNTNITSDS